jgi:hypothetical protein
MDKQAIRLLAAFVIRQRGASINAHTEATVASLACLGVAMPKKTTGTVFKPSPV